MNYRLGTLGFLSGIDHEHRGNFGVRDQQMAIEWVHRNIEYFGGSLKIVSLCLVVRQGVAQRVLS